MQWHNWRTQLPRIKNLVSKRQRDLKHCATTHFIIYYLSIIITIWTASGVLPCGSVASIRQNTQIHISHKMTHHTQTNQSTQSYTVKDTLHTMNKMRKKSKAIPVAGRGWLQRVVINQDRNRSRNCLQIQGGANLYTTKDGGSQKEES
jgi:hypothetical protein